MSYHPNLVVDGSFKLSTRLLTLLAVFLSTLSAGTASTYSLRLVLVPQELAQKTANIIDKRLGDLKFKGNLMLIQKETGTNQFCPSLLKCLYEIIYDILI